MPLKWARKPLERLGASRMGKTNEIATTTAQIELTNPSSIMAFATNIKDLIVQNNLYTDIKGKNYVNVEGWQIAGAFTGVFPVVESVENLSDGEIYKYRAEVSLYDQSGSKVGSGVAICTNKEAGKKYFDEYAIASMAQTRAVGKAFRMKIGWLLKIAGYETTPAEEMDAVEAQTVERSKSEVELAKDKLAKCKTLTELKSTFVQLGSVARNDEVIKFKNVMKISLGGADE